MEASCFIQITMKLQFFKRFMNEFISLIKTTRFIVNWFTNNNAMFICHLRVGRYKLFRWYIAIAQINQWKSVRRRWRTPHANVTCAYKSMSTLLIAVGINTYSFQIPITHTNTIIDAAGPGIITNAHRFAYFHNSELSTWQWSLQCK